MSTRPWSRSARARPRRRRRISSSRRSPVFTGGAALRLRSLLFSLPHQRVFIMKFGRTAARLCAAIAVAGGVLLSAQQLPSEPPKQFGTSITGAFEGWFDNPDGSHSLLVGYLNRNRAQELDIPI